MPEEGLTQQFLFSMLIARLALCEQKEDASLQSELANEPVNLQTPNPMLQSKETSRVQEKCLQDHWFTHSARYCTAWAESVSGTGGAEMIF